MIAIAEDKHLIFYVHSAAVVILWGLCCKVYILQGRTNLISFAQREGLCTLLQGQQEVIQSPWRNQKTEIEKWSANLLEEK